MSDLQYQFPHEDGESLDNFYGNPRGRNGRVSPTWVNNHLAIWTPVYPMFYSEHHIPLKSLQVHKLCIDTFNLAFSNVLKHYGIDKIKELRLDISGGTFNYRPMRGGSRLSAHAYGIAIDMDPNHNPFPHPWTSDGLDIDFVNIMQESGFWWRGYHGDVDPMHFQCCYRGTKPDHVANPVTVHEPLHPAEDPHPAALVHPADTSIPGRIYNFFINNGLTKEQACGIVANVQAESGFDINNVGDGGLARGLFQMHPDRRSVIWEAANHDMKHGDIEDQCAGALWELNHVEKVAYRHLKASETAYDAGYNMCRWYERPASHMEWVKRGRIAVKWYNHFNS